MHSLTVTNTNGAGTSPGFVRRGLAFEKGDVASGQTIGGKIGGTAIRTRALNVNTYTDGSMRSCFAIFDAGTFAASETKTIDVENVSGANVASTLAIETYFDSIDDLTVQIRNHTGSDNNTNVGNLDFSIQTALDTATRLTVTDDTDLCVRFNVWQQVSPDEHLICVNYVDVWLDTDGSTPLAIEWGPLMTQDWIVDAPFGTTMTKQLRNYDAEMFDGVTSLGDFDGLAHACRCQWMGHRTADDDFHGRRFWIDKGSAMPTLNVAYSAASKQKMAYAGYIPPVATGIAYDQSQIPNSGDTYTPLGLNNHRAAINGGGGYPARGSVSSQDVIALSLQTAESWRIARVSAFAGLSVFFHLRDHRSVDGDTRRRLVPFIVNHLGPQSYAGLGDEDDVTTQKNTFDNGDGGFDSQLGGVGVFSNHDDAHHHSYSYLMAFVEGEPHFLDATFDSADYVTRGGAARFFDIFSGDLHRLFYDTTRGSDSSIPSGPIPSGQYGMLYMTKNQERQPGWTQMAYNRAYQLAADSDPHKAYFSKMLENADEWINDSLDYFPADALLKGGFFSTQGNVSSLWMNNFGALALWDAAVFGEDEGWTGFKRLAEQVTKVTANYYEYGKHATAIYRDVRTANDDQIDYLPLNEVYALQTVSISSSVFSYTPYAGAVKVRDDDLFYLSYRDDASNIQTQPPELSVGTKYFVVNADTVANTFQLSATEGGSALTVSDDASLQVGIFAADFNDVSPIDASGATLPGPDSFAQIAYATIERAWLADSQHISQALIDEIRTWYAPMKTATTGGWLDFPNVTYVASWNMDASFRTES